MTDRGTLSSSFEDLVAAYAEFRSRLRLVRPDQWNQATPCREWSVRSLVNHVVLGELSYALLLRGGTGEAFLAIQDQDVLGPDPVAAYERSTAECLSAFHEPGALDRVLDYPLGAIPGGQLLGLRLTETIVHTWDLARAVDADDHLDPYLVEWIYHHLDWTYRGVAESPIADRTEHLFFAGPPEDIPASASLQDRLLHRLGRATRVTRIG
jgi:uncharacterized protein (TIGR03086 family)